VGALFHPGRSAVVLVEEEPVGAVGEIHPRVVEMLDLPGRVAAAELEIEVLLRNAVRVVVARDVPRFPPVRRDLAFVVDEAVPASAVQGALEDAAGELLGSCVLFDVFAGEPLPAGKKSLAFSLDLRAPDRTLASDEADAAVAAIAERLARDFSAGLRAG